MGKKQSDAQANGAGKRDKKASLGPGSHLDDGYATPTIGHEFEQQIFRSLDAKDQGYISPEQFRRALMSYGLMVETDERLRNIRDSLEDIENESGKIDIGMFHHLLSQNLVVSSAFDGKLIIPDFAGFTQEMREIYQDTKKFEGGANAGYIPQLARVNSDQYGLAVTTIDGQQFSMGDKNVPFCVQSCSKPISYCMALEEHGEETVHKHIGREPSGRNFNEMALDDINRPHNPMINSGAIMACSLVKPKETVADRFDHVTKVWTKLAGGRQVSFSNSVYLSERATANRNFCLGYMMQEKDSFPEKTDLVTTLEFYFMCCSLELDCEAMSIVAATLANGGLCPVTGVRVFDPYTVRNCLSLMFSCGMYDFSGEFAFSMGFPAKSGVAGSLMIVIPGVMGICTWSPRLDQFGNSVRGVEFCRLLGERFPFHNYDGLMRGPDSTSTQRVITRTEAADEADNLATLLWAAKDGDLTSARRMLARGTGIDAADYDGRTALHIAATNGQLEMAKYLVAQGASPNVTDRYGARPVDDATRKNHANIVALLGQASHATLPVPSNASAYKKEWLVYKSLDTRALGKIEMVDLRRALQNSGISIKHKQIVAALCPSSDPADFPGSLSFDDFVKAARSAPFVLQALRGEMIIPDFGLFCADLKKCYDEAEPNRAGNNAAYIPQLAVVNPEQFGVAVCTVDGQEYAHGDTDVDFCIQSCSKVITYAIAQELLGQEKVHQHVGREASGRRFNDIALDYQKRPHNPMINAGAIMAASMVKQGEPMSERYDYIRDQWAKLTGGTLPRFSNPTYLSELSTADRNHCLAYMMQEAKSFPEGTDIHETLRLYFQCCSLLLNTKELARVAGSLANGGVCPITGERVFSARTVRNALSLTFSCGMYDFSGEFAFTMGFPAKSGVAGALLIVIPGIMGICTFSPRLDHLGNSVRGIDLCRRLGDLYNLHNYDHLPGVVSAGRKKNPLCLRGNDDEKLLGEAIQAAAGGDVKSLIRLRNLGVCLERGDYDGRTPLHLAAAEGHYKVVKFLLGCNVHAHPVDQWGSTPAEEAKLHGHEKVAELLKSRA